MREGESLESVSRICDHYYRRCVIIIIVIGLSRPAEQRHRVQTVIRNSKAQKKEAKTQSHNEYHTQAHTRTHMHSLSLALSLSPIGDNRSLVQSLFFDIVSLCFAFDLVKKKKKSLHTLRIRNYQSGLP